MKLSLILLFIFGTLFLNVNGDCSKKYGCWKGKCWSGCRGVLMNVNGSEWCYAKNSTRDEYIPCSNDSQCYTYRCNPCKGACSI